MNRFITNLQRIEFTHQPFMIAYRCNYAIEHYDLNSFTNLDIHFPEKLQSAVLKRQAEFLAGRFIAKQALQETPYQNYNLSIGQHRYPLWPDTLVGSITHTDNTAICAVADKNELMALGIDLENSLSQPRRNNIEKLIINESEQKQLTQCSLNYETAVTLAFSAKESLFKALYPHVGHYFDFNAAHLSSIDLPNKKFTLQLKHDLSSLLSANSRFDGNFIIQDKSVFTLIAIPAF